MAEGRAECQQLEAAGRGHSPKLPPRSNQRGKRLEASHKKRVSKICPLMHSLIYSVRLGSFRVSGSQDSEMTEKCLGGTQMCKGRFIDLLGQAAGGRSCRGSTRDIGCGRTEAGNSYFWNLLGIRHRENRLEEQTGSWSMRTGLLMEREGFERGACRGEAVGRFGTQAAAGTRGVEHARRRGDEEPGDRIEIMKSGLSCQGPAQRPEFRAAL